MGRKFVLGLGLETKLGLCRLFLGGGIDAQTHRLESTICGRTVGVARLIKRHAQPECVGVCIEEPYCGLFSSVKALFPMLGAVILACELEGLPWSTAHLAKLKTHATGKGNAKKPDMQAAALARWGVLLEEDEANAAWAAAFALDRSLFG